MSFMEAINYYIPSGLDHTILSKIKDNSICTLTDSLGRLEYVSDDYCQILETHSNRLIGEPHELLRCHLHTNTLYKNLWRTIKMGQKWSGVLTETLKNGKTIVLDATIIPISDDIENTVKYIGLYNDVTKLHSQKNQIVTANGADRDFLNVMPFHVFLTSKHGKVLNVNKPYNNKEVSELVGTYIYDCFSLESFEKIKNNIEFVASEKTANQFEITELDATAKPCKYSILIAPVFDELRGLHSLTVTVQKNNETYSINKEREAGKKCRLIYQSLNIGIVVVTDHNGKITEWNNGAEAAFGYTESEILGKPLTVLISRKSSKTNIKELLKSAHKTEINKDVEFTELPCLSKSKKEFIVEFALNKLTFGEEKIYVATMLDVTQRKALENKLELKTKDLESSLYRSAQDLKSFFSSAKKVSDSLKKDTLIENKNFLKAFDKTVEKSKLLSERLAQASLQTVHKKESSKIDFHEIIEDTLQSLSLKNNLKGINIVKNRDTSFEFFSNSELLKSIFYNVIHNAIIYSKAPTKSKTPCITITVQTLENKAMIKISDSGIGIRKEHLEKIFDLYYRVNDSDDSGFGLGLYTVKRIVDDLNGEIQVQSKLNKGTSFIIELPNLN